MSEFNFQPVLEDETLRLRPLTAADFDALQKAAGDPRTWADHPAKDRWKPEVFAPYFAYLIKHGALAITQSATGEVIGSTRFYLPPDEPEAIAIGFTFLNHHYWGGRVNRAVKRLMLTYAFAHFDEVWFHIAPQNIRSQIATRRFGVKLGRTARLDFSGVPADWLCFRLSHQDWCAAELSAMPPSQTKPCQAASSMQMYTD